MAVLRRREASPHLALSVASRIEESFAILELTGTLTLGPTLSLLLDAAREALANPKITGLIVFVGGIVIVDSSGLSQLVLIYTIASKRHCALRLVEVSPNLRRMLEMTRIDELLPSSPTIAAAKNEIRNQEKS